MIEDNNSWVLSPSRCSLQWRYISISNQKLSRVKKTKNQSRSLVPSWRTTTIGNEGEPKLDPREELEPKSHKAKKMKKWSEEDKEPWWRRWRGEVKKECLNSTWFLAGKGDRSSSKSEGRAILKVGGREPITSDDD